MTDQIHDLQRQLELTRQQLKESEDENKILKKQIEQEVSEKIKTLERFPTKIDQVKPVVMKMVYSHKELQLENLVEAIQEMSLTNTLQREGMSFCLTKYKTRQHPAPNYLCAEGFSITRATIDLSKWQGDFSIGTQVVLVESLFENGLLSKLTIIHPR